MNRQFSFMNYNIFFQFLDSDLELSLQPIVIGYERCNANKEILGSRTKSHYIMHFVMSGTGYFSMNGTDYEINGGTIFLIPPGIKTAYRPDREHPWEYMWVEFTGFNSKNLLDKTMLSAENPVCVPENAESVFEEVAVMIDRSISPAESSTIFCTAQLLRVLDILIQEQSKPQNHALSRRENRLRPVLDYIQHNYCDSSLTVESIAEATYFNASYLSRIFKQALGVSPTQYIIELRMRKACQMLKYKAHSITEIASSVGYKSPFYFSKEFRRLFNIAPSRYVDQVLLKETPDNEKSMQPSSIAAMDAMSENL